MTDEKRIKGNVGTLPQTEVPATSVGPPPQSGKRATLITDDGRVYVMVGNSRIDLDDRSVSQLSKENTNPTARVNAFAAPRELKPALEAAGKHRDELLRLPGVVSVRAGYKFIGGRISDTPCVVVAVQRKFTNVPKVQRIPPALDGVPTDVAVANPYELLEFEHSRNEAFPLVPKPQLLIDEIQTGGEGGVVEEALPQITYEPPPGGNLEPVTGAMTLTCHVSPDAGWRILKPFLEATRRKLCLGMYDFTAPHIYQTVRSLLRDSKVEWRQVLDPKESLSGEDDVDSNKANDIHEKDVVKGLRRVAGGRFDNAFAHIGSGQTVASAYHIKVAVRDESALWLSSGNWQSSNQPNIDFLDVNGDRKLIPQYNREWHVVVDNETLAERLQVFLDWDFTTAKEAIREEAVTIAPELLMSEAAFFEEERAAANLEVFTPQKFVFTEEEPLTIQPILTPDNYLDLVLQLLRKRPSKRLYFQNQSLNPIKQPSAQFSEMMRLLADYSNEPELDVRIIFRNIGPMRQKLESLKVAGFNMERVRMQTGCHTKGIIIDSKTILLGSHNFTNQGVQVNRDASLLMNNEDIARYYEKVFLHDWEKLSRDTIREEANPIPVLGTRGESEATELRGDPGVVRIPWGAYEEE